MTMVENENAVVEMAERETMIENIRRYCDLLQTHPNLPVPYSMSESLYLTEDEARAARRGIYGWKKTNNRESSYISYRKVIGGGDTDDSWSKGSFTLEITVSKADSACERVVTGTRHVEAYHVDAYDEEVIEWRCDSDSPPADETVFGPED
jgi:hypothetical protein